MSPRTGITPHVALKILQGHGVACELQAHAGNYRIKGLLRGIVYAVDFYEPIPDTPDVFSPCACRRERPWASPSRPPYCWASATS
jgi:hypothetical protein